MYNTDRDPPPKRPVVTSLAGALSEIARWQADNQLARCRDAEGLVWELDVKVTQVPNPADPRGVLWQVRLALMTQVTVAELVKSRTLDPGEDARLIELVGGATIELSMKPQLERVPTEDAARAYVADRLPSLKLEFSKTSLRDVKRSLVGRWVDAHCRFGGGKNS